MSKNDRSKGKTKKQRTSPDVAHARRRTRASRTPAELERQEQVFHLHLCGKTYREIATQLGINKDTVTRDIRRESERRAEELGERRETEKARSVAVYEDVIRRAVQKSDMYDTLAREPGAKVTDRTLDAIISARERIDKVLGIDAPTKVDVGLQHLVDALQGGDEAGAPLE